MVEERNLDGMRDTRARVVRDTRARGGLCPLRIRHIE
jgi:hypothetical protein